MNSLPVDPNLIGPNLTVALLNASNTMSEAIYQGVVAAGFPDLRPAHGFVFARVAAGEATAGDVAVHLGVTKQAAAKLVEELVGRGYLARLPHPKDARAQLLSLTDRGWAATRAADEAAYRVRQHWAGILGAERLALLAQDLNAVAIPGPMKPTW